MRLEVDKRYWAIASQKSSHNLHPPPKWASPGQGMATGALALWIYKYALSEALVLFEWVLGVFALFKKTQLF